jgi:hypothetical protein
MWNFLNEIKTFPFVPDFFYSFHTFCLYFIFVLKMNSSRFYGINFTNWNEKKRNIAKKDEA